MGTATRKPAKIEAIDTGDWLRPLLDEARKQLVREPNRRAVARMRARILASIDQAPATTTASKRAA